MKNISVSSNKAIINLNSQLYTASCMQKTAREFFDICTIDIILGEKRTIITIETDEENTEQICMEFLNHLIANMKSI